MRRASDGLATRDRAGQWGDPLGVRPYRRGDPLRRVHWVLTARHGELIVRELQSNAVPRVQIVLDAHPAAHRRLGAGRLARMGRPRRREPGRGLDPRRSRSRAGPRPRPVPGTRRHAAGALGGLARCPGADWPRQATEPSRNCSRFPNAAPTAGCGSSSRPTSGFAMGVEKSGTGPGIVCDRAPGRGVRIRRGPRSDRTLPLARDPLDPDRRPGGTSTTCLRRAGKEVRLVADRREEVGSAGRPRRWRGSPPSRWSKPCWSRAGRGQSPWPGRSRCSSPRCWPLLVAWNDSQGVAGAGRSRAANDRRGGLVQAVSNPIAALLSAVRPALRRARPRGSSLGGRWAMAEVRS